MNNVISRADIEKYGEGGKAAFSAGTILTPSAWDWANEHKLEIIIGGPAGQDRDELLRAATGAVLKEFKSKGLSPDAKIVAEAVRVCLEKLGCKIENK